MNCVSEKCKYVRCKDVKNDDCKYFKSVLVFECALGGNVSYPFIDDGKKDMRCRHYKKAESEVQDAGSD